MNLHSAFKYNSFWENKVDNNIFLNCIFLLVLEEVNGKLFWIEFSVRSKMNSEQSVKAERK